MNDAYTKALKNILTDCSPPPATIRSAGEIETDIEEISRLLKGHLSNFDRLDLVESRRMLRKQIAALSSAECGEPK